jgi:hypothetical protein
MIEGPPDMENADRWEYGPSWVAFQCGKVVDWHSSPLRPLRARTPDRDAGTALALDREC